MVKIRLQRFGKHKAAFYRLVAADSRSPRDGKFIEILGTYNPIAKDNQIKVDEEKALLWLIDGAKPTDSAKSILTKLGLVEKALKLKKEKGTLEAKTFVKEKIENRPTKKMIRKQNEAKLLKQKQKAKEQLTKETKEKIKAENKPNKEETKESKEKKTTKKPTTKEVKAKEEVKEMKPKKTDTKKETK